MNHEIHLPADKLPKISLCDYLQCREGFVHPDRVMDVNVLLYVEQGSFHLFEEEMEITLHPGEMIFLKQGLHHFGEGKCPDNTKWFFVHFHLPEENGMCREAEQTEDIVYQEQSGGTEEVFLTLPKQITLSADGRIFSKLMSLKEMFQSNNFEDHIRMNAFFYQILLDIYRENRQKERFSTEEIRTNDLMRYLDDHLTQPFDSAGVSEYMGLTYKHMNRIFKQVTGITVQRYFAKARMEKGAQLLRETNMEVGEIAQMLGYVEQCYFSNSFKKEYGVSPAGYRRELDRKLPI